MSDLTARVRANRADQMSRPLSGRSLAGNTNEGTLMPWELLIPPVVIGLAALWVYALDRRHRKEGDR